MSTTTLTPVSAPPTLVMQVDGRTVPMTLEALGVDVAIAGLVARTTMTLRFRNPHPRDLEGELTFPLPEGAALAGYGLDIDGELVDASLVEKTQARVVFEAEVRKNVDPGLLERVAGNQFRTRIWPLPAEGTRTIRVSYVSALSREGDAAVYALPLRFSAPRRDAGEEQRAGFAAWGAFFDPTSELPAPADAFHLRVAVAKGPVMPQLEGLGFQEQETAWVAELRRAAAVPEQVRVGLPGLPPEGVQVEPDDVGVGCFFRLDLRVDDPEPPAARTPARVALVWDASLSRAEQDKARDLELLRALLKRWSTLELDLLVLRDALAPPRRFSIVAGESHALCEALAELPYDGGTRLGSLELDADYEACLLFTDGLGTLGEALPETGAVPVTLISSSPTVDAPLLRFLAARSGGEWIDLQRVHPAEAAQRIGQERLSLLGIEHEPGAIADLLPSGRRALDDGAIGVCGRLLADEAELTLRFGRGTRETARRTVRLNRARAGDTGLVGRLWAQARVDELAPLGQRHADTMLELGRRFGIVTPNTSFLVLETLAQHLEHGIPPAPTRTAMRADYDARIGERAQDEARRRATKLDRVAGWWRDLVSWWETEFDPTPPEPDPEPAKGAARELLSELACEEDAAPRRRRMRRAPPRAAAQRSAPAPAPAPPPPLGGAPDLLAASAAPQAEAMRCLDFDDEAEVEAEAKADEGGSGATRAGIAVKPWDPDTPYLQAMKDAGPDAYRAYLAEREEHGRSPSFYLDCANLLFRLERRAEALRVLSNVAELELESPQLLRIVGYKLESEGELSLAAELFEQVLVLRPEEPQSYRDLGLVLDRLEDYRRAAELLWKVVEGAWDDRFPEIETIALMELNRVLARAARAGHAGLADELGIEERFRKLLDVDLRVALAWDADLTDVDLWVHEPLGEKCYYSHNLTRAGGRMSRDFTQGYGPEVYTLRKGVPGAYTIQANYYSSSQQTLTGPTTLLATVFTNYGRPEEERQALTVRLASVREVVDVGAVTLGE